METTFRLPEIRDFQVLDTANTEWSLDLRYIVFAIFCAGFAVATYIMYLGNHDGISPASEWVWTGRIVFTMLGLILVVAVLDHVTPKRWRRGFEVKRKDDDK